MVLEVKPKISIIKGCCKKVGEFWYNKTEDSIAFELPFPLSLRLKIIRFEIPSQLDCYDWKVEATPAFMALPTIMRGSINVNLLCLLLDSIRFTQEDKILIHGSCYEQNNKGILNIGFQNTGKTYNTYKAVQNGAYLISEEHTVIDNDFKARPYKDYVKSCLSWRTIRDCDIYITPTEAIQLALRTIRAKCFPFIFEAAIYKKKKVSKIITKVDEVRIGGEKVKDIFNSLVYMTENEYTFMSCDILVAYAYASGFPLRATQLKRRDLLLSFANYIDRRK